MKRALSVFLVICLTAMSFCGCSKPSGTQSNYSQDIIVEEIVIDETSSAASSELTPSDSESQSQPTESVTQQTPDESTEHIHDYEMQIQQEAEFFKAGTKKYVCKGCNDSYTKSYTIEKIKLLAIGNSFSLNSMWCLYDLFKAAGVQQIDIAIMYIGGCSLDKHWECLQTNSTEYQLYRNNSGKWNITDNYTLEKIFEEKDWDIITLQQKSEHAGDQTKFSNLDNMVDYVNGNCPNAAILWNMTWAFTNDSKYMPHQQLYDCNDVVMYQKIAECAQNIVAQNKKIHTIVPVGTAVMNARTSSVKNEVHQADGSHLSEKVGYYVGAYTWFSVITGMSPYDVNLGLINFDASSNMNIICESAQNAIKNPYKITQSNYID